MPFVDELKPEEKIFALFVSRSGAGKTTAAASFPKPEIFDFDGRIRGVSESLPRFNDRPHFEQFLPPSKGWNTVSNCLEDLRFQILQKISPFQTLIWDSFTAFCNLMINESMDIQKGRYVQNPNEKEPKKNLGLRMAGPADYGYESSAAVQILNDLRGMTQFINIIVTGHVIPRYGKPDLRDERGEIKKASDGEGIENVYADSEEIGEKVAIRDKIRETCLIYFNEVYYFEKKEIRGKEEFFVKFSGDVARSALGLKGEHNITGKNFYDFWKAKVTEITTARRSEIMTK